jgi:Zn-dependent peptidase ImmA (M78 family)
MATLTDLPRIRVTRRRRLPASGLSFWDGQDWVICVSATEPVRRQHFTAFHEFKHVVDHVSVHALYGDTAAGKELAETAADFFAGCVLVQRDHLIDAWNDDVRGLEDLAELFGVSTQAVTVRLAQVGLITIPPRTGRYGAYLSIDIRKATERASLRRSEQEAAA